MTNKVISFRISAENYLRLEILAAEKGLSVSRYLKQKTERELEDLAGDVRLMQSDVKEILAILSQKEFGLNVPVSNNLPLDILMEILMILRETVQPSKLSAAQKMLNAQGYKIYDFLGKDDE